MTAREAIRAIKTDFDGEKLTEARLRRVRLSEDTILIRNGDKLSFRVRGGWQVRHCYTGRF